MRLILMTALAALSGGMAAAEPRELTVDVWADNWFEMYVNGEKILEDSVPITTERSFNAETASFTAELPATVAFLAKDFKENDTGLEYIGTRRQQPGDGGLIAQFRDAASGTVLAVTDSDMRCVVVHHAPLDRACAEEETPVAGEGVCGFVEMPIPEGWTDPGYDDSGWSSASEHSAAAVSPKGGYDQIDWDPAAKFVWGDDLVLDNTVLCRMTIDG